MDEKCEDCKYPDEIIKTDNLGHSVRRCDTCGQEWVCIMGRPFKKIEEDK